ncbi:hypothetical protein TNCV_4389171 [Trichonephila clavipes]|nr:hypothetical protein TNCV_4389171 [Trichonephila clavipes]
MDPIPRHLKRGCCPLSPNHHSHDSWEYTSTGLTWLLTRTGRSAAMPGCILTTCSNALDSMNKRLTTRRQSVIRGSVSNGQKAKHQSWINNKGIAKVTR